MPVHSPPSVKPVKAQAFVPDLFHISPDPYQSNSYKLQSLIYAFFLPTYELGDE